MTSTASEWLSSLSTMPSHPRPMTCSLRRSPEPSPSVKRPSVSRPSVAIACAPIAGWYSSSSLDCSPICADGPLARTARVTPCSGGFDAAMDGIEHVKDAGLRDHPGGSYFPSDERSKERELHRDQSLPRNGASIIAHRGLN